MVRARRRLASPGPRNSLGEMAVGVRARSPASVASCDDDAGVTSQRGVSRRMRDRVNELERGRRAYTERAWLAAYELLTAFDGDEGLAGDDLDALATCAFMLGRDDELVAWLESAHTGATWRRARHDARPGVRSGSALISHRGARSAPRPGGSAGRNGCSRTRTPAPSAATSSFP